MNDDDVTRLASAIAAVQAETRQQFDISLETARHETPLVAEGVAHLDTRLSGRKGARCAPLPVGAHSVRPSETQAMIKFSHAELDRRVRSLEEGFADLQARVERLESSTH